MFFCKKCHSSTYRPVSIGSGRRREITARLDWFERMYLCSESAEIVAVPQQVSDILRLVGDII